MMIEKRKTLAALQTVVVALAPLDPEARRQVMEATHALIEIGAGRNQGRDARPKKGKKSRR
ncbi:MAG: hypothetical protein M0D55_13595 [Elusimicrobiota bacterium]|nr:MAG: hypothetical protein M0D55_13595 [Elusimicrobiota bacterium]